MIIRKMLIIRTEFSQADYQLIHSMKYIHTGV